MEKAKTILITVITAIVTIFATKYLEDTSLDNTNLLKVGIIFLIILILIASSGDIYKVVVLKFNKTYGEFIYEKMTTTLEYLDKDGQRVSHDTFVNINRLFLKFTKMKQLPFSLFSTKGNIFPSHGKCINAVLVSQKENELNFKINFKKENVFDKKFFYAVSSIYENEFIKKDMQFWDIPPKFLCKQYILKIIYPEPTKNIECEIRKAEKKKMKDPSEYDGETLKWEKTDEKGYITTNRYGQKVATIILHDIKNTEAYRISWKFI